LAGGVGGAPEGLEKIYQHLLRHCTLTDELTQQEVPEAQRQRAPQRQPSRYLCLCPSHLEEVQEWHRWQAVEVEHQKAWRSNISTGHDIVRRQIYLRGRRRWRRSDSGSRYDTFALALSIRSCTVGRRWRRSTRGPGETISALAMTLYDIVRHCTPTGYTYAAGGAGGVATAAAVAVPLPLPLASGAVPLTGGGGGAPEGLKQIF
jgi:hypothetical protein